MRLGANLLQQASLQSGTAPLPLLALLLFREPSVLTLRTLLAFPGLGERIHQLRAVKQGLQHPTQKSRDTGF